MAAQAAATTAPAPPQYPPVQAPPRYPPVQAPPPPAPQPVHAPPGYPPTPPPPWPPAPPPVFARAPQLPPQPPPPPVQPPQPTPPPAVTGDEGPGYEQRSVRSHRKPPDGNTLRYRIGAAVLVVVALAVGSLVIDHTPDVDEQQQPFVSTTAMGKTLGLRTFDVSVESVRGAAVISDSDQTHDTSGVWILVKIRLVAVHKATTIDYAVLRDAQGRTYSASTRVQQSLVDNGWMLQPGVPIVGEVVFEVPVAVATNVSVRLATPLDTRLDAMADIPLAINADTVRRWKATTTPVTPDDPAVAQ